MVSRGRWLFGFGVWMVNLLLFASEWPLFHDYLGQPQLIPWIAFHSDCRREEGGRDAIKLRNIYKVLQKKWISVGIPPQNPFFSRAFGALHQKIVLSLFHQPGHVAAETTHEGASLEGTKAASLAPAFDMDWYEGKNYHLKWNSFPNPTHFLRKNVFHKKCTTANFSISFRTSLSATISVGGNSGKSIITLMERFGLPRLQNNPASCFSPFI